MANRTLHSSTINFMDFTDNRKLDVYISSNLPTTQIYNANNNTYSPNWTSTNLQLTASIFADSKNITPESDVNISWWIKDNNGTETQINTSNKYNINKNLLTVLSNELISRDMITFVCKATYKGMTSRNELSFMRVDSGINGRDGNSIQILGAYDTVLQLKTNHPSGEPGDAYVVDEKLYVWASEDEDWINIGNIRGPSGKDAKIIKINADSQVFKVNKSNNISPSSIRITSQAINTVINSWTYSTDGGVTFSSSTPKGVYTSGDKVTILGKELEWNSIVIKASDGIYSDTITIYKVFDGIDGKTGEAGSPAPLVFLTNENVILNADSKGQVSATTIICNVVSYVGLNKTIPVLGTITGLPEGMTLDLKNINTVNNEKMIIIDIDNKSNLGSINSNSGVINIPIISPVNTVLKLYWNKINEGKYIKSISIRYAVTDNDTDIPTSWDIIEPKVHPGQYLWTADYILYNDESTSIIGARVVNTGPKINKSYFASEKYKQEISNITNENLDPSKILNIPVKQYKYIPEYSPSNSDENNLYIGLITEDVAKNYPIAVEFDDNGNPENWNVEVLTSAILNVVQQQQKEIDMLKNIIRIYLSDIS